MNIDIEKQAIGAVRDFCVNNPYLDPELNENDRSLVWDGFINIFYNADNSREVDEFLGRVAVQVKGKKVSNYQLNNTFKFPVKIADIRAYLRGGGCLYFVVVMSVTNNTLYRHLFYYEFYQKEMRYLLEKYGNQKTRTIEFKKFPSDHIEQANLLLNYSKTYKEGSLFVRSDTSMSESQRKELKSLKFNYISVEVDSNKLHPPFHYITKGTHNLFGTFEDESPSFFPVDQVSNITISGKDFCNIGAGTTFYFDKVKKIWQDGNLIYQTNPIFRITVQLDDTHSINFTIKPLRKLSEHLMVAKFIQDLVSTKILLINDNQIDLTSLSFESQELINYSEWIISIRSKLDSLGVSKDLVLQQEENSSESLIHLLHIDGKALKNHSAENQISFINVGNIRLLVEIHSKPDGVYISNFFNEEEIGQFAYRIDDEDETMYQVSKFLILDNDSIKTDNFNAEIVLNDIYKYEIYPQLLGRYNQLGLDALLVYDETSNLQMLLFAKQLFLHMMTIFPEKDNDFLKINYFQSVFREEGSITKYTAEINRIAHDHSKDHTTLMCCNILLSEITEAKKHFEKLDSKSELDGWPIMNLLPSEVSE